MATTFSFNGLIMRLYILSLLFLFALLSPLPAFSNSSVGALSLNDEESNITYEVKNGDVHFIRIVENLPLTAEEIYDYSLEFIEEAYKITKYQVTQQNRVKGFVVGEGEYLSFESRGNMITQYVFNCKHALRVDCKEGRARISVIVKEYDINIERTGSRNVWHKPLVDVAPINKGNGIDVGMYEDAFYHLKKIVNKSVSQLEESLRSKQSSDAGDW